MAKDTKINEFLSRVFDTTITENVWQSVVDDLAEGFQSPMACLATASQTSLAQSEVVLAGFELTQEDLDIVEEIGDPFVEEYKKFPLQTAEITSRVISHRELKNSQFYNEYWLPRLNQHECISAILANKNGIMQYLSVARSPRDTPFTDYEKKRFQRVVPFVARALKIGSQFQQHTAHRHTLAEAFDMLGHGLVVVRHNGQTEAANRTAEHILRTSELLSLNNRKLRCKNQHDNKVLQEALDRSIRNLMPSQWFAVGDGSLGELYSVIVLPILNEFSLAQKLYCDSYPTLMVIVTNVAGNDKANMGLLTSTFGLSRTEAEIASKLVDGHTVKEISMQTGRSPNTIKYHVKSIFEKTHSHKQSELVGKILKLPGYLQSVH